MSLADHIDSTSTEDQPPPQRRFRLVLDLHADTRDALDRALTALAFSVHDDSLTRRTSGGADSGYHVEIIDHGEDVTHESYVAALTRWQADRHGIPLGASNPFGPYPEGSEHG